MTPRKKAPPPRDPSPPCAVSGCMEPGEFKAPASRDSLEKYQYLCLEHVKKFNQAWDYFGGWDRDEIEAFMHSSVHGHRPTWSVHHLAGSKSFTQESLEEALARMLGDNIPKPKKPETKAERQRRESLATLNLEPDADAKQIKTQYKTLVKKYHPDVNDSKEAEDTFKRITEAYVFLTKSKTA